VRGKPPFPGMPGSDCQCTGMVCSCSEPFGDRTNDSRPGSLHLKMPATLQFKTLPLNHGNQILEMWIVCRRGAGSAVTEIAEHPDGAMKAYASKRQAEKARRELAISGDADRDNPWAVETIWLLHKGYSDLPAIVQRARQIRSELAE
jgi:hypothetical protein